MSLSPHTCPMYLKLGSLIYSHQRYVCCVYVPPMLSPIAEASGDRLCFRLAHFSMWRHLSRAILNPEQWSQDNRPHCLNNVCVYMCACKYEFEFSWCVCVCVCVLMMCVSLWVKVFGN